jgi:MATE family multidrug resistance protein
MANNTSLDPAKSEDGPASLKQMLSLAAPMIVTNISFTIMQFVDRFMVSRLGTDALAAVLPAGIVSFLPASFAIGVSTSINTFVSQSLGQGKLKSCSEYCWQAMYMGFLYTAVVVGVLWPSAQHIFKAMGHEPSVINMEVTYLRILLYAHGLMMISWCTSNFFMGVHRPVITMYAAIVGQSVNIACNYVLIFGKLGFPAMGIAGAGWGTFIGMGISALIRMSFFLGQNINEQFQSRHTTGIDFGKMKELLRVGFPAGIGLLVNVALWGAVLFWLVGIFGKESLAATSAVFSCINVSVMPVVGISTALTAAVGRSIGRGRKDLAIKQTRICLRIGIIYMGLAGLCFFIFRQQLMAFWSVDDKVIATGVKLLICAAIYQVFDAAAIIYSGALRGAGDTLWLALVAAFGSIVLLGGGGILIVRLAPELGALGPWIATTTGVIAVGLANRWRFKSNHWMKINIFEEAQVGVSLDGV